ncbi:MAG: tRNA dihydrouridine synthase DusB [Desulfobacterales bacterium]|jgi:nifR3 family TIM-barrel protein|nr:tRNA dihydrouridine synthase DusB [Desulfobacterales bacterium]
MKFAIGTLQLDYPTVLAPLAGITNLPFRKIVKEAGCGLVCTEMVSANGLVYGSEKTRLLMQSSSDEKPLSVQIFGSDPFKMADAAVIVQESGADIIDINFGCAVKKILKSYAGVALMKNPALAREILKKVRNAVTIPLTIKMRSGWDSSGKDAFHLAQIAQDCGVDAVTLHPRTASQGFSGKSNWALIAALKKQASIPVIGNGDIAFPEDALEMIHQTGCDAVMVGRAAIGNPWIFSQVHDLLQQKSIKPVDMALRIETMKKYLHASAAYFGELNACRMMRSRLGWFVKGLPQSARFRHAITKIRTCQESSQVIDEYYALLSNNLF